MARTIGIDPGITGAVALLDGEELIWSRDLPLVETDGRKRIDAYLLASMLREAKPSQIVVERVHASPGMGVSSAFHFGETFGLIQGALAVIGWTADLVTPQAWKTGMRCPADKKLARQRASELFGSDKHWPRASDHGRAEAALIALYGARQP